MLACRIRMALLAAASNCRMAMAEQVTGCFRNQKALGAPMFDVLIVRDGEETKSGATR